MSEITEILHKDDDRNLNQMVKSGDAFTYFSPFEKSKAYEVTENGVTKKYIEFDGSSDQEDLVGDIMQLSALEEMKESAPGTIMLRDHNRSTDKVFGWITAAELVTDDDIVRLRLKAEVDEEDAANVRIWNNIAKGRKLGASVTVIIVAKGNNPNREKGLIIKSVKLLEVSIVTIPCNQDSWTLAATAAKALAISEHLLTQDDLKNNFMPETGKDAAVNESAVNSKTIEEKMGKTQKTANAAPAANEPETKVETPETTPAAGAAEVKETAENEPAADAAAEESNAGEAADTGAAAEGEGTAAEPAAKTFPRAQAAMKLFADRKKAAEDLNSAPAVTDVATKGLFAEEQSKRQPTFWDLTDILYTVNWQLRDRRWAVEWAGMTDTDDFDYVAAYYEACEEFAEAAVKSFAYYGGFTIDTDDVLDANGDGITDDVISNALDLEKSFANFAEIFKNSGEVNKQKMLHIGESFVEAAKSAGIIVGADAVVTASPNEIVRKSQIFIDAEKRADEAEAREKDLATKLNVATAALETAVEAINLVNGQPLQIGQ